MNSERRAMKNEARRVRNKAGKLAKAAAKVAALANPYFLVPASVEHDIPTLTWLGGKQYPHHGLQSKTRPGNKSLHAAATVEDASRTFTKEVDKALVTEAESTPVPVVPMDAAPEIAVL